MIVKINAIKYGFLSGKYNVSGARFILRKNFCVHCSMKVIKETHRASLRNT